MVDKKENNVIDKISGFIMWFSPHELRQYRIPSTNFSDIPSVKIDSVEKVSAMGLVGAAAFLLDRNTDCIVRISSPMPRFTQLFLRIFLCCFAPCLVSASARPWLGSNAEFP